MARSRHVAAIDEATMTCRSGVSPRPRRAAARTTRVAAMVTAGALAVLLAACSGSASSTGGSPASGQATTPSGRATASPSTVAYSACMRSHGIPNYPDPDSDGQLPKTDAAHLGVSSAQFQSTQQTCMPLLPTGGSLHQREYQCIQNSDCPASLVQQMLSADRVLAGCMRTHGWPNFPDPITDSHGPIFNISAEGISDAASHSHSFESALNVCGRLTSGNAPEAFE